MQPVGGHAIYLDAKQFYPHMPQDKFPAQTLAAELYIDSGVRSHGTRNRLGGPRSRNGRSPLPGSGIGATDHSRAASTRRRTWMWWPKPWSAVWDQREQARGLEMVYEPQYLRFFQARFKRI